MKNLLSEEQMKPPSLLNAALRWFLLGMVVANIASEMVFAFLPVYLTRLGASVAEVGLVFSVASVVPLALQILGGWLSDSIGRLRTIALGALGGSLGYIGFVLAPSWEWVLLALGFEYISGSLVGPSYSAFIAEQSSQARTGEGKCSASSTASISSLAWSARRWGASSRAATVSRSC